LVSGFGGATEPDFGFEFIFGGAEAFVETLGEVKHGGWIIGAGSFFEEFGGFFGVGGRDAAACHVEDAEIADAGGVAAVGGLGEEAEGFVEVQGDAGGVGVAIAEEIGGAGVAGVGGLLDELDGEGEIFCGNAATCEVGSTEAESGAGVALVGACLEEFHGFFGMGFFAGEPPFGDEAEDGEGGDMSDGGGGGIPLESGGGIGEPELIGEEKSGGEDFLISGFGDQGAERVEFTGGEWFGAMSELIEK